MVSQGTTFARYSKSLCWVVSIIALLVAIFSFAGGGSSSAVTGGLWLMLAIVFAISAIFLSRSGQARESAGSSEQVNE